MPNRASHISATAATPGHTRKGRRPDMFSVVMVKSRFPGFVATEV